MDKITTKRLPRNEISFRSLEARLKDYASVYAQYDQIETSKQCSRCMTCGVPFCNWGCPLGNLMPDINQMVSLGNLEKGFRLLAMRNPFPEITCHICPALCESACALGINETPVPIRDIELMLVDNAQNNNWLKPRPPITRTGLKIAIVGSGPAGLAVATSLNKIGHTVTVFEKNAKIGGLLRYGIPDYKLDKSILDQRINILCEEGIIFSPNTHINTASDFQKLADDFDALVIAIGCEIPRDIDVCGREADNVVWAMDFLTAQNMRIAQEPNSSNNLHAKGKNVVIIGAGDTGYDCAGTAARQGALSITLVDIAPMREKKAEYPDLSYSYHPQEDLGKICDFRWQTKINRFVLSQNSATRVELSRVRWIDSEESNKKTPVEVQGSMILLPADLIIVALGFVGTNLDQFSLPENAFFAGDARTGQSLVVSAIADGISIASQVDSFLEGQFCSFPHEN